MENTASELVRFALDEAGFAEDGTNVSEAAQRIGKNFNRTPYNAAMSVHRALKQTAKAANPSKAKPAPAATGGTMSPQDWEAHVNQHHKGVEPQPGHCKYLNDDGTPPVGNATSKPNAAQANETNVGTEHQAAQGSAQAEKKPEQETANQELQKMGASAPSPALQAAYQAAQAKMNQPTPIKVEGVEGLEGLTLYPKDQTDAQYCGQMVAAAKAGSETAKAALKSIQKQGDAGAIQAEVPTTPQAQATQPVDAHAEWEKMLPTDPKQKLAVIEQEELERVQNLREQMKQLKAEGKDISKLEAKVDESKQRVMAARAEAQGRDLEAEAAAKAQAEAEAEKPKEMSAEEYAQAAEQFMPTTSAGMLEQANRRFVDAMKALNLERQQAEQNGKAMKDYFDRMDAIKERYKRDKQEAEMVAAKESESAQAASAAENQPTEGQQTETGASEGTEGAASENAESTESNATPETEQGATTEGDKARGDGQKDAPESRPLDPLSSFFQKAIDGVQPYITQEDADTLNGIDAQYQQEPTVEARQALITSYAAYLNGIVDRAKAEEAQKAAMAQNKEKAAGFMGGIRQFFGGLLSRIKADPRNNPTSGLRTAENGKMATPEHLRAIGCALGWDNAMRSIGFEKNASGQWVGGGPKYLCRGPRGFQYNRVGKSSIIERPETGGVQENIDVKRMNLENALATFHINAQVKDVRVGAAQTTFELEAAPGTNIANVKKYKETLMAALGSKTIGIQTPIPGTNRIGVTIENQKRGTIPFSAGYNSPEWQSAIAKGGMKLPMMYGRDEYGHLVVKDIAKIGHFIIGGSTNTGKSAFMKTIETGLMTAMTPNQVRFVHMNPVGGDVEHLKGSPYLAIPNAESPQECSFASDWLFKEMENRKAVMQRDAGTADFEAYNSSVAEDKKLPYIVVFADEYGNQMSWRQSNDPEIRRCGDRIDQNMTQMVARARHMGIHIVVGVQRPDVNSVNGTMKMNCRGRVAFGMASGVDYGTIMDKKDLRPLEESAQGTCYFRDGSGNIVTGQSVWAKDDQTTKIVNDYLNQAL